MNTVFAWMLVVAAVSGDAVAIDMKDKETCMKAGREMHTLKEKAMGVGYPAYWQCVNKNTGEVVHGFSWEVD